jgi:hypothetical protein
MFLKVHVWLSHICTYSPPYLGFQTLNLHQRCGVEPKTIYVSEETKFYVVVEIYV